MHKILVIDDNEDTLIFFSDIIESSLPGADVFTEQTGEEGIRAAQKELPDVIILDVFMPGMDGLEVCKILKAGELTNNIPIIMMTAGKSDPRSRIKALEYGADIFLLKPINGAEFIAHVKVMLRIKKAEDTLRKEKKLLEERVKEKTKALQAKLEESKRMEENLRESERKYQDLYDNAPDMFVSVEVKTTKILHCNQTLATTLGYGKEELDGQLISFIYHPDCKNDAKKVFRSFQETGKVQNTELQLKRKDGSKIDVNLNSSAVCDKHGNIFSSRTIYRDITERKRIEETLRESEEKYRTLFEDSKDVIFFSTPGGKVLDVNPAGIELFAYSSKKEFLNIDIAKDLYVNPRDRERFQATIQEQGFLKDFELKMKKKNGTQIATLLSASIERDKKGNITAYRGIIRDITKRVRDEQILKTMNAELRETNEKLNQVQASLYRQGKLASIGQLAAGVAHEINNPLGFVSSNFKTLEKYYKSIENYLQLIEDSVLGVPEGPGQATHETIEKMKEHKEKMGVDFILDDAPDIFSESNEGFDRIKNIVENLRSFSRVDYEHKIEKYDINQAVENTLAVARNEIKYAADVETEFSNVSLIECRGDEINQVLLNIIVNAAQAIKSQTRKEMGKIKIKTYQEEKYVYCEISDDGPGIPGKIIDKVFDPFFTTKEVGKGTGLGLNICHDIVINKHGGDLTVKSETGKGSTFSIKLPTRSTFKARESKE